MKKTKYQLFNSAIRLLLLAAFAFTLTVGTAQTAQAQEAGPAPVNLGAATSFAILTKTGITNVPISDITGNLGVSPIAASAITGFSLVADSTNRFSTSSQVTGKIYAANYAAPTPANLSTAISNMETAYTDAAGRTLPDFTELYAGNLSGKTLAPGLYKWSTDVLITTDVTLSGGPGAVWIFQIAGNLKMGSGAKVLLAGGAQAGNIFWQVGGGIGVEIGTTAHLEGTVLAKKAIHLRTGASLNGRALAQTAVTLAKNKVVIPSPLLQNQEMAFSSIPTYDGWVLESGENSNTGGTMNSLATTINIGDTAANKQYRAFLHFNTSGLPDTAVIVSATIKIMQHASVGSNPFGTHGNLLVDIHAPYFGLANKLAISDFQSKGTMAIAKFGYAPIDNWYSATLNSTGQNLINHRGATQFRLRFAMDDNNNDAANYIKFYSGDAGLEMRPRLIVRYYVP